MFIGGFDHVAHAILPLFDLDDFNFLFLTNFHTTIFNARVKYTSCLVFYVREKNVSVSRHCVSLVFPYVLCIMPGKFLFIYTDH